MPKEVPIDSLSNSTSEVVYRQKNKDLFKKLAKTTNFTYKEVEALAVIHKKIVETLGPMNRAVFHKIMHSALDYTENIRHLLVDRVFYLMDPQNKSYISLEHWIRGLSIILRGTLEERIPFAYKVYDLLNTNNVQRNMVFPTMQGCLIKLQTHEDLDDSVKDLIEMMIKKYDSNRDGGITIDEFQETVTKTPLFLECMGPVFPSRHARGTFLTTFCDDLGKYWF